MRSEIENRQNLWIGIPAVLAGIFFCSGSLGLMATPRIEEHFLGEEYFDSTLNTGLIVTGSVFAGIAGLCHMAKHKKI